MKKTWIAAILIPALLLCGCGSAVEVPAETTAVPYAESQVPEVRYDNSLVGEVEYKGEYLRENWTEATPYHYRLPQLLDDTEDARTLNEVFQDMGRDAEKGIIPYERIVWESHWHGSLLSLVLTMRRTFLEDLDYFCYHYDFEQGKLLTNEELLERFDFTPEEAQLAMRRAAAKVYDRETDALAETYGPCFAERQILRAETLSLLTTDITRLPLYPDSRGDIHAFGLIGTFAGGGAYTTDLTLEKNPGIQKTSDCDFIRGTLTGDGVTVRFENQGLAEFLLPGAVEYEKEYPLEGLYGTYTDAAVSFLGNGGEAYLFLLDDTGHVSFCNLTASVTMGFRFRTVGPLVQPDRVVGFSLERDEGGSSAYAVTEDGTLVDLYEAVRLAESLPLMDHYGVDWETPDGSHCLRFRADSPVVTWVADVPAEGTITRYLGMTEEGMFYELQMTNGDGSLFTGLLMRECISSYTFPEGTGSMTLTRFAGPPLFGMPESEGLRMGPMLY